MDTNTAAAGLAAPTPRPALASQQGAPIVDIVIPVYNEEAALTGSVLRLVDYIQGVLPFAARITIADNASTDDTWPIAQALAHDLALVRAIRLDEKGRGRALAAAWSASDCPVLAYMDVDLSTDLAALLPLLAPLVSGHSDVAIGTRLAKSARVRRGPKREILSRGYNLLLRVLLSARFSDAQCGFKAIRAEAAAVLLPHVKDTGWFFDTELLVLAERAGLRIHEVPVDWIDDPDSRVEVIPTAMADLWGIARVATGMLAGKIPVDDLRAAIAATRRIAPRNTSLIAQFGRFVAIGVGSALAYLVLFLLLRDTVGAQPANAASLLLTTLGDTAANRRWTFGVKGRSKLVRHHGHALLVFAFALALIFGSLAMLRQLDATSSRAVEVVLGVTAYLVATLVGFLLLRHWVFGASEHLGRDRTQLPGGQLLQPAEVRPVLRSPVSRDPASRAETALEDPA